MRRNLTLEEAGVLDLRKFLITQEDYDNFENYHLIGIPADWFVTQGFNHLEANWENEENALVDFIKNKFSVFICWFPGSEDKKPAYFYRDTTYIAVSVDFGEIELDSFDADTGKLGLTIVEY